MYLVLNTRTHAQAHAHAVPQHNQVFEKAAESGGVEKLYASFVTPEDIKTTFGEDGEDILTVLLKKWNELEVRRLEVNVIKAENLPEECSDRDPPCINPYVVSVCVVCKCRCVSRVHT